MSEHPTGSEEKASRTSLGGLFGEVTRGVSTLMRQEIELAKAELAQSAKRAGRGAGLLGGAGYAGAMMLLFLSIALWWSLGEFLGNGWSAVIVAVIWGIIALVFYLRGRAALRTVRGAPQTVDSLKKIPETLKKGENR